MFVRGSNVQDDAYHFHVLSDAFELPIHEDMLILKPLP